MKSRIGDYFVGVAMPSLEQIEEVLKHQHKYPGEKFGEIAVKLGMLKQKDIDEYLERHV